MAPWSAGTRWSAPVVQLSTVHFRLAPFDRVASINAYGFHRSRN
jgi:hypothetical protein